MDVRYDTFKRKNRFAKRFSLSLGFPQPVAIRVSATSGYASTWCGNPGFYKVRHSGPDGTQVPSRSYFGPAFVEKSNFVFLFRFMILFGSILTNKMGNTWRIFSYMK